MPQRTPAPRIGGGRLSRAAVADLAHAGRVSEHPQPRHGHAVELLVQDVSAAERCGDACRLYRVRPARAHAAAARRDRGLEGNRVVREHSASRSSARSIRRPARSPNSRCRLLKPGAPKGILGMRFDEDENLWLALQFQGGVAKFDTGRRNSRCGACRRNSMAITCRSTRSVRIATRWTARCGCRTRDLHLLRLDVASRPVRGVRAVQDPAAQRLRRDSGLRNNG